MATLEEDLKSLKSNFIISVSCLGAACACLLIAVIGLIVWNVKLAQRIKKLDPFVNFKLQRPSRFREEAPTPRQNHGNAYDNPAYPRNPMSQPEQPERRDLNPIAIRSKASFDNGNFIFGDPNSLQQSNSFKGPDYLDQDSRFY